MRIRIEKKAGSILPELTEVEDEGWMFTILVAVTRKDTEMQVIG